MTIADAKSRSPEKSFLSVHRLGDMIVRYPQDALTGRVGFELLPADTVERVRPRRERLTSLPNLNNPKCGVDVPAFAVDSLVQLKLVGDASPGGFAQGRTMRNSASVETLAYEDQSVSKDDDETRIRTSLKSAAGLRVVHSLTWRTGDGCVGIFTEIFNGSSGPVTLEMLSSFSLGGLTPFDSADAPLRLLAHRFRSAWSAEGRLETSPLELLQLERSWNGYPMFSERFGQVGSMPVRGWFPFLAIEDTVATVTWGAQLAWGGSWQMEIYRQNDDVNISGGLADREFGHWKKVLPPGETFQTPPATVACVSGGLDELCDRLTRHQHRAADTQPEVEHDLPIVFNEWCTTFGHPAHDHLVAMADRLKDTPTRYLVIDAGWYKTGAADWSQYHGDWIPNCGLFPEGLAATAAAIRKRGLIPGLWFEMETLGPQASSYQNSEGLLKRDGIPITSGIRRFWDLNHPAAIEFLSERVIDLLDQCGFGYLKVDYNDNLGIGCDHPDSLGEGLRRQIDGVHRFFERIRARLPELVIESCSSGGHRLEPSFLARAAMSCFSDSHETVEIPIIAANHHRLLLPRQSQVWAVLRSADNQQRLAYSLAATFLGRMCLSGNILELSPNQWNLVLRAQDFYRAATPTIKYGTSRRHGTTGISWRHPQGWQAVLRIQENEPQTALVVAHAFQNAPQSVILELPEASWKILEAFPTEKATLHHNHLTLHFDGDFSAQALLLRGCD